MNSGLLCGPLGSDTTPIAATTSTDATRLSTAAMAMMLDFTTALPLHVPVAGSEGAE